MTICKSDLSDKIKLKFFQAVVVSVPLHGCTIRTLMTHLERKLDRNHMRMLHAVLNKSSKQHTTKQQLYGHLHPISQTIQARHVGHCWGSKDELIIDVFLYTPTHELTSFGQTPKIYGRWLLFRGLAKSNDQQGWIEREIPEIPCSWYILMKMMN